MSKHQLDILPLLVPIQKDVDGFLQRFSKERSSYCRSFRTFKNIWNDMHLHLIYSCQTAEELFVFQEFLLDTVKNRLLPPYPSLWQLGAVYLLFAFTELVPYKRHLSIIQPRLTLDDLKGVQKLLRYLRLEEEFEAIAIFMYTLQNHCQIVACPLSDMYIELRKQYSHRFSNQTDQVDLKHAAAASVASSNICDSLDSYIGDHLESFGFLNKMVATNNRYCALKSLIPDVKQSSLCSLIGRNLVANFSSSPSGVHHNEKTSQNSKRADCRSSSGEDDIGLKRYQLKYKSFAKDSTNIRGGGRLQDPGTEQEVQKSKKKAHVSTDPYNKPYVSCRGSKMPVLENLSTVEKMLRYRSTQRQSKHQRPGSFKKRSDLIIEQMAKKIEPQRDD